MRISGQFMLISGNWRGFLIVLMIINTYFLRRLAVTSDKKSMAGALSHPPRIFFPDAVTGKTVDGPFKIPTDVIGPDLLYSLIFSQDDKFLFLDDLTNGFLLNKDVL